MRITLKVSVSREQIGGWTQLRPLSPRAAPFLYLCDLNDLDCLSSVCVDPDLWSAVRCSWPGEVCTGVDWGSDWHALYITTVTARYSVHLYCALYGPPHLKIRTFPAPNRDQSLHSDSRGTGHGSYLKIYHSGFIYLGSTFITITRRTKNQSRVLSRFPSQHLPAF